MYHELEVPGRSLCQADPGYVRYIISAEQFRAQIGFLHTHGWLGLNVSQGFSKPTSNAVVITFDDGCETDLLTAAPILAESNFDATFFITVGFLDNPGYLSKTQLRRLSESGFDIGCHSMTHPYLNDLSEEGLHREIAHAKNQLEQIIGKRVENFSCPGGRWDRRVAQIAKQAGYKTVCTSQASANSPDTDRFRLGRVAIMRGTSLNAFHRICCGDRLWRTRLQDESRAAVKRLLGNSTYDRIRAILLHPQPRSKTHS
jgi:peptidoglycan/xylan/chitin deacetylase (PgdA/CDA1 family)